VSWYRKNPLFATGLAVCTVLALGEMAFTFERWDASRATAKKLQERRIELQAMTELRPPPTKAVSKAIETDLAKALAAAAAMQAELKGRGPAAEKIRSAKAPAARTDAYFDLATYVEKLRELAKKQDVEVRAEAARFGFSAYANEGPLPEHMEPVFRQRQVAQYLLESLIEAKPRALLSVKRERSLTKSEREARIAAAADPAAAIAVDSSDSGPDYFTIDSRMSARVAGYLDTLAFRFVFTGQTAALRLFLNRLAAFDLPVLVREVEVDVATPEESVAPASNEEPAASADQSSAASVLLAVDGATPKPAKAPAIATPPAASRVATATPIVFKPLSKYTVTVEFVELVPPAAPPAESAPVAPTS